MPTNKEDTMEGTPPAPTDDATPLYTAENLPPRESFSEYSKKAGTPALRIEGPFRVETSEGTMDCTDGWLAIDTAGNPYPIAKDVFEQSYGLSEPAEQADHLEVLRQNAGGVVAVLLVRHSGEGEAVDQSVEQLEAVANGLGFTLMDRRNG
jgi:hypothetical protein